MSHAPCPVCVCTRAEGVSTHAIVAALVADDLDRAIELGLLTNTGCTSCSDACAQVLATARDTRLRALAARERFRVREARQQRRANERASKRAAHVEPVGGRETVAAAGDAIAAKPALPSAAAAALARAKAKAAERGSR